MTNCSNFNVEKFNKMVREYNERESAITFSEASDYADFCSKFPITGRDYLRTVSEELVSEEGLSGCYIVSTSGTTSKPLVMANRIWKNPSEDSYPRQFYEHLVEHVFSCDDIVANLFFPGGFGLLYEGTCRFLEPIGATILPIGRMDSFENDTAHFDMFRRLKLNTLVGTPASIVEFAQASQDAGVSLDIRKIVFSGESFYPRKRNYIKTLWPDVGFYSLYGATEFGLVGISTPDDQPGYHHIFEDWFFLETDDRGNLLVTDLKSPLTPIIRYRTGDNGILYKMVDGTTKLVLQGRSDDAFNCGGALITYGTVCGKIRSPETDSLVQNSDIQLILQNGNKGQDILKIVLDLDLEEDSDTAVQVRNAVQSIKEISEDVERGAVELSVHGRNMMVVNRRSKTPTVLDQRHVLA